MLFTSAPARGSRFTIIRSSVPVLSLSEVPLTLPQRPHSGLSLLGVLKALGAVFVVLALLLLVTVLMGLLVMLAEMEARPLPGSPEEEGEYIRGTTLTNLTESAPAGPACHLDPSELLDCPSSHS